MMKRALVTWLLFGLVGGLAAAEDPPAGKVRGTVVKREVSIDTSCAYVYWLKVPQTTPEKFTYLALEPESRAVVDSVGKQVEVEGRRDVCHGVEHDVPVLHVKHLAPVK
jgi:hypothetical protein